MNLSHFLSTSLPNQIIIFSVVWSSSFLILNSTFFSYLWWPCFLFRMQVSTQFKMRVVHIGSSAYGFERRRFIWFHSLRFTRSQGWTLSNARLIVSLIVLGLLIERFRMPSYFYSRRSLFGLLIERFRMLLFRILIQRVRISS